MVLKIWADFAFAKSVIRLKNLVGLGIDSSHRTLIRAWEILNHVVKQVRHALKLYG